MTAIEAPSAGEYVTKHSNKTTGLVRVTSRVSTSKHLASCAKLPPQPIHMSEHPVLYDFLCMIVAAACAYNQPLAQY